jgi:hypothetical protein
MSTTHRFTYRGARSGAVTAGFALAIVVETIALHLWLVARHPALAWALTLLSVAALLWLPLQYRAMGRGAVVLGPAELDVRIGSRVRVQVPLAAIAGAEVATWRSRPDKPDPAYLDATAPAEPNVLLTFTELVPARLAGGLLIRRIRRLGLHLDEPAELLARIERRRR